MRRRQRGQFAEVGDAVGMFFFILMCAGLAWVLAVWFTGAPQ